MTEEAVYRMEAKISATRSPPYRMWREEKVSTTRSSTVIVKRFRPKKT